MLGRANIRQETVEIVLNGADGPVVDGTPDFVKSIPIDKALDDNTLDLGHRCLPNYSLTRSAPAGIVRARRAKQLSDVRVNRKPTFP